MDILIDTIIDNLKLIPFLFITYLCMEYLEHKTSDKTQVLIKKAGFSGPLIGSLLGALPQCGFSVVASNFYTARIIGMGTLIAIYLSTSDEMLPILISSAVSPYLIAGIIGYKILCGIIFGYAVYGVERAKPRPLIDIERFCKEENCHCGHGILKPAVRHTIEISLFIFIVTLFFNIALAYFDIHSFRFLQIPLLGELISGIIGLLPNCSASVILTQLYLEDYINISTLLSGSLVNGGVGLLVLFRVNKNWQENLKILGILYGCGILGGLISCLFFL
ncbi:MAG: arsenic efflux protein [Alphaproteobacteria bacterium]|nr:arsenic efflux protein [Alphaproteobacteria bacterium]